MNSMLKIIFYIKKFAIMFWKFCFKLIYFLYKNIFIFYFMFFMKKLYYNFIKIFKNNKLYYNFMTIKDGWNGKCGHQISLFYSGLLMNISWVLYEDSKSYIKEVINWYVYVIKDTLFFVFVFIPLVLILFKLFPSIEKYFISFYESVLKYESPDRKSFFLDLWIFFTVILIIYLSYKLNQMVCFYMCFEPVLDYFEWKEADAASLILFLLFLFLFFTKKFFWEASSEFYSKALAHPVLDESCKDFPWKRPHWKGLFSS